MIYQERLKSLSTKGDNYLLGRMYFKRNDAFQNAFVYQPTFSTLQFKKDKGIDYVISWKLKRVCNSTLFPQDIVFLHSIKLFRHKIGGKFDKDPLVAEQNNYKSKIVNAYIAYDSDNWPKTPT